MKKAKKKGYFISIEGGDGSGKSTQISNIESYLKQKGHEVLLTREPGGTPLAEKIREMILDPENKEMTARTEMLLYAASRAQHLEEKIIPALMEGKTVITDRFTDSSIAYQGYGRCLGYYAVSTVNIVATNNRAPDITIYLDIKPEDGIKRKSNQKDHKLDRLEQEKLEFHKRVYQGYEELIECKKGRIVRVDANRPADEVFKDIKTHLDRIMK